MNITLRRIFEYYDCPQVFEAVDPIGGTYIGTYVEERTEGDYIIVGTAPEKMRLFRRGSVDLLSMLTERPEGFGWAFGSFVENDSNQIALAAFSHAKIPDEFLPLAGFVLHPSENVDWIVQEAREKDSLILALTVEPPEAAGSHRIHSDSLGKLLINFQRLIKYAYSNWAKTQKGATAILNGHVFDVQAFKGGSFQVLLEPSERANLFGSFEATGALEILGRLFESSGDPTSLVSEISTKYRGHFASAYRDFLDLMISQQTRVEIAWADTTSDKPTVRRMSATEAQTIRTALGVITGLTEEILVLTGALVEANRDTGNWILETSDGKRHGKRATDGPSLEGCKIGASFSFRMLRESRNDRARNRKNGSLRDKN